jgi:hypothetical protein
LRAPTRQRWLCVNLRGRGTSLGGFRQKCASVDDDRRVSKLPGLIDDRAVAKGAFLRCGWSSPQRSMRRKAGCSRMRELGESNPALGQKRSSAIPARKITTLPRKRIMNFIILPLSKP